jgi:hypothetical protein
MKKTAKFPRPNGSPLQRIRTPVEEQLERTMGMPKVHHGEHLHKIAGHHPVAQPKRRRF